MSKFLKFKTNKASAVITVIIIIIVLGLIAWGGYSLLKKEELLQNPNRHDIYLQVADAKSGITVSEIALKTGLKADHVFYHLNRLKEYNMIRKVDRVYYLTGNKLVLLCLLFINNSKFP